MQLRLCILVQQEVRSGVESVPPSHDYDSKTVRQTASPAQGVPGITLSKLDKVWRKRVLVPEELVPETEYRRLDRLGLAPEELVPETEYRIEPWIRKVTHLEVGAGFRGVLV